MSSEAIMNPAKPSKKNSGQTKHRRESKNSVSSESSKKSRESSVQKDLEKNVDSGTVVEQKTNGVTENGSKENGSQSFYSVEEHTEIHTEIIVEEVLPGEEISSDVECHIEPLILVDDEPVEPEHEIEVGSEQSVTSSDETHQNGTSEISETPEESQNQMNGTSEMSDVKLNQNVYVQIDKMQTLENGENGENGIKESEKSIYDFPLDCEASLDNSSTLANYSGNNSTQNVDLSIRTDSYQIPDEEDSNDSSNSFTQQTKHMSFAKSLKMISARKSIGDLRQESFRNIRNKQQEPVVGQVFGQPRSGTTYSLKRKYETSFEAPTSKKVKSDNDGFFSYISSPFNSIRNRFSFTQTVSPAGDSDEQTDTPKRWCTIQ